MTKILMHSRLVVILLTFAIAAELNGQSPYQTFPDAEPPYYRVRYDGSTVPGELVFPVNYTVWIPPGVETLRGVIVHQHGCGEGSCKSGLTAAFDLHWQALAKAHHCALLGPAYEQPQVTDCQLWCDPRNGSGQKFQQALVDLGAMSYHPELATVPWALWGHSGGGHRAGGMTLLHPERVAAAWLRSGVPLLEANPDRPGIKQYQVAKEVIEVPMMCNLGTKEGVTVKEGRFAKVWSANETFFTTIRGRGGLVGVAVDPLTAHECGNQRYLAILWLNACLHARLPENPKEPLQTMSSTESWLAPLLGNTAVAQQVYVGDPSTAVWLPNEAIAQAWMQYVANTNIIDDTPPSSPTNLRLAENVLTWEADADLESGVARFIINRDGKFLKNVPDQNQNPFGRPLFQGLQYSDTPTQPLVLMQFVDDTTDSSASHTYEVIAENTVGRKSEPTSLKP